MFPQMYPAEGETEVVVIVMAAQPYCQSNMEYGPRREQPFEKAFSMYRRSRRNVFGGFSHNRKTRAMGLKSIHWNTC